MDRYTFEVGKHYGYPECCIRWFSKERIEKHPLDFTPLTGKQEQLCGTGFIPCPACAEKVTVDTLHTLITNRECTNPFPEDDDRKGIEAIRKKYSLQV